MTDDNIEEQLRAALRARATVPAATDDPVPLVESRMKQRTRRRSIAVATTAALCVAGIAIEASALASNNTKPLRIGPAVGPSIPVPASPRPTSPSASSPPSSPLPSAPASTAVVVPSPSPTQTLPSNVSSLTLPTAYAFFGLDTDSGPLSLNGAVASSDPNAPCMRTPVDPGTLTLGAVTTGVCGEPTLSGERVAIDVINPDGGSVAFTTSIAVTTTNPKTGTPKTGPVVMRISEASDTNPVVAYGGGSLWIYDVDTSNGPEAIQVSATSGQVQDVVRTPELYRPIMVANADGLWLGNSIEGSPVAGTLFHVAPESHVVTTVVPSPNDAVDWMVADSGHVWAAIRPNSSTLLTVCRFDGPRATVAFRTPEPSLEAGTNFVVGDEQDGLWLTAPDPPFGDTPAPTDNQHLDVVRLDPNTGKPTVEAQLPPLDQLDAEMQTIAGQAAFFAGNYFLLQSLQSPSEGGYTAFTQLLRVTPLP